VPIYEFVCEACGRLAEVMQKMGDPPPAACPECGEGRMARMVSRTSFQLKGGGWYSDLYGSTKTKPAAPEAKADTKDTKADAKTEAKADAKTETKPATPAPPKGGGASGPGSTPGSGSGSSGGAAS
jgi:putative FmdB family regulatory protein